MQSDTEQVTSINQPVDSFDNLLPEIIDEKSLKQLEMDLGFDAGGTWWLDLTREPIELNSQGQLDLGNIIDIEANVHKWLRKTFDHDPNFSQDSYHLLNRLNELARLQGLVEEASLNQNSSTNHFDQLSDREHQIYHSTLSVLSLQNNENCEGSIQNYPHHRTTNLIVGNGLNDQNKLQIDNSSLNLRHSLNESIKQLYELSDHNTYRVKNDKFKFPLSELSNNSNKQNKTKYSKYNQLSENSSKFGINNNNSNSIEEFHESNHHNLNPILNSSPIMSRHKMGSNYLDIPNQQSHNYRNNRSMNSKKDLLSRTYSKEQLELLKTDRTIDLNKSDANPKFLSQLKGSYNLRSSLPISNDLNNVTQSLDVITNTNQLGPTTNSSTNELLNNSHDRKYKLSSELQNLSSSNMCSLDVYELARLQESHLREHSGSRNKLTDSNNSLNSSLKNSKNFLITLPNSQSPSPNVSYSSDVSNTDNDNEMIVLRNNDQNNHHINNPERQHTIIANPDHYKDQTNTNDDIDNNSEPQTPLLNLTNNNNNMNFNESIHEQSGSLQSNEIKVNSSYTISSPSILNILNTDSNIDPKQSYDLNTKNNNNDTNQESKQLTESQEFVKNFPLDFLKRFDGADKPPSQLPPQQQHNSRSIKSISKPSDTNITQPRSSSTSGISTSLHPKTNIPTSYNNKPTRLPIPSQNIPSMSQSRYINRKTNSDINNRNPSGTNTRRITPPATNTNTTNTFRNRTNTITITANNNNRNNTSSERFKTISKSSVNNNQSPSSSINSSITRPPLSQRIMTQKSSNQSRTQSKNSK